MHMPFGISGSEIVVILIVVAIVVGPSRIPQVTQTVARWVRTLRLKLTKLRSSLDAEYGEELKELDFRRLDPRQYDPRHLVREAVRQEMDEWMKLVDPHSGVNPHGSKQTGTHLDAQSEGLSDADSPFDLSPQANTIVCVRLADGSATTARTARFVPSQYPHSYASLRRTKGSPTHRARVRYLRRKKS